MSALQQDQRWIDGLALTVADAGTQLLSPGAIPSGGELMNSLAADHAAVQLMGRALYRWRVCCQDLQINLDINQHAENCWNLRMADRAVYLMRVQMVAASHLEYAADQCELLAMARGLQAWRMQAGQIPIAGRRLQARWQQQQKAMVGADTRYAKQLNAWSYMPGSSLHQQWRP